MPAAEPPLFSCADTVTVRLPVRPRELVRHYGEPVAHGAPDESDRLAGYLAVAARDAPLLEAITLASPSLRQRLDSLRTGPRPGLGVLRKAVRAVVGYQLRMASRSTPYGTFAAVALARIGTPGKRARANVGEDHRRGVRPDAQWLLTLVSLWEQRPEVADRLSVVTNSLAASRGDRLVLSYVASLQTDRLARGGERGRSGTFFELALPRTDVAESALREARRPILLGTLREELARAFPRDAVDAALTALVRREFLLTDARPDAHEEDPIAAVLDRLDGVPDVPELSALREIHQLLADYGAAPPGAALHTLDHARRAMAELLPGEPTAVHVDLAADADLLLPAEVAREAEQAAEVLWRLSPPGPPQELRRFHEAFTDLYGTGVAVPVLELLDPDTGLGPPQGYRHPPVLRQNLPSLLCPDAPERVPLLADIVFDAVRSGRQEVELDTESLRRLDRTPEGGQAVGPPRSTDFPARLLARGTAELDAGHFRLWLTTGPGSDLAGAASARFAHALGPARSDLLREVARRSAAQYAPELTAQLDCRPVPFRSGNITRLPHWTPHRLPVGLYADPADPLTLVPSDLAVVADDRRLRLVSLSRDREVVPLSFHMLEFERHAPNLARLLSEIPMTGARPWQSWDWGSLSAAPFLPRVRYGRTVLTAARWRLDTRLSPPATAEPALWTQHFTAWAERSGLPRRVLLGTGDQRVETDLTCAAHVELIRKEAARGLPVTLEEAPFLPGPTGPDPGDGWLTGPAGAHANEVVFPLFTHRPAGAAAPRRLRPQLVESPHLVGGPWLYAKLYIAYERHDEVIGVHLPELLAHIGDHVDRWFFLRYGDPDPHLRVRFHGSPQRLTREVLPALHTWAERLRADGLLGRVVLDSYRPETARYGGPRALKAAERAFQADSELVVAQLSALREGSLSGDPVVLCAVNQLDALRATAGPEPWAPWLLARYPRTPQTASVRNRQKLLDRLLDGSPSLLSPGSPAPALARLCGPGPLASAAANRAEAFARYGQVISDLGRGITAEEGQHTPLPSLLHMHYNRAVCIPPAGEDTVLVLVRNTVQGHLDRQTQRR
ncbi:lantibiotic dehydratase [Streptomyces sp. NBC_01766]|uniref:lantibiotic dehydratase n=1 Tax=Streptomyces sp. NBC_01766 TaxID=2975936 RepID=UPI002DD951CF|nr:lantibiotic dehydratase [Streptomyces sp. NBC_01766]WSC24334.1 lantibiotic dehydratase [Streptomyces sp. NBC_01766]